MIPESAQKSGTAKSCRRHHGCFGVHFLLASGRYCFQRSGVLGLLCRRYCRARRWAECPMVRAGGHAVQFRGAFGLYGKFFHVRARRRLCRGARRDGTVRRACFGFVSAVRLHPDRAHQRGQRGPVSCRTHQRSRRDGAFSTLQISPNWFSAGFAILVTLYFW